MKKIIILIVMLFTVNAQAGDEYYIWSSTNAVIATNALNYINSTGWFPVVGKNAKTGKDEPNNQKTTSWATKVLELKTGGYGFLKIPTVVMDALKVSVEDRMAFMIAFMPSIEEHEVTEFKGLTEE